jgi:Phasin protein
MSKRKAATASKHARSPKIAAKAQRANQAIVRSPKDSRRGSVAAGSIESSHKGHNNSKQEAPESPAAALQDDFKQTMRNNESNRFDFSSATASARTYQAKLLEMAQANMQFALEFAQRLATIGSPFELLRVIEELTTKRIAMFRKYSKEIVELSTRR